MAPRTDLTGVNMELENNRHIDTWAPNNLEWMGGACSNEAAATCRN